MAQQPNIELRISDLPRPVADTGPEIPWVPDRPGDLTGTGTPWGGAFGTPGPDAGFALRLSKARDLVLAANEHRSDADAAVGAVAMARASRNGRGPAKPDIDAAIVILGYDAPSDFGEARARVIGGASHHHPDRIHHLIAGIPIDVLDASVDDLRERAASGESLVEI
jgi:hypothetical protein